MRISKQNPAECCKCSKIYNHTGTYNEQLCGKCYSKYLMETRKQKK